MPRTFITENISHFDSLTMPQDKEISDQEEGRNLAPQSPAPTNQSSIEIIHRSICQEYDIFNRRPPIGREICPGIECQTPQSTNIILATMDLKQILKQIQDANRIMQDVFPVGIGKLTYSEAYYEWVKCCGRCIERKHKASTYCGCCQLHVDYLEEQYKLHCHRFYGVMVSTRNDNNTTK